MDDVFLYNRSLASNEIQQLYNATINAAAAGGGVANNLLPVTTQMTIAANAAFDMNGGTQTIGGLSGPAGAKVGNSNATTALLYFDPGNGNTTFGGTIQDGNPSGGTGGKVSLNIPSGNLTLTGTNTYSGPTVITDSGVLRGGAAFALSPSSDLTVNGGGTLDATGFRQTVNSLTMNPGSTLDLSIGKLLTATYYSSVGGTLNLQGAITGTAELLSFPDTTYPSGYDGTFTLNAPAGYVLDYLPHEIDVSHGVATGPSVWSTANSGSWNSTGSWTGGVPNLAAAGAVINQPTASRLKITLDAPQTVGTLLLGAGSQGGGYTVHDTGSNKLTFDNAGNGATITVTDGAHEIDAPVVLNDDLTVTSSGASTWTLSFGSASNIGISETNGSRSLTMSGTNGTLVLSGSNHYSGGTFVNAGMLVVASNTAFPDGTSLTVGAGGTLSVRFLAGRRRPDVDVLVGACVFAFAQRRGRSRAGNRGAVAGRAGGRRICRLAEEEGP